MAGLRWGLAGSVTALVLVALSRRRDKNAIPVAGILITSGAVLALSYIRPIPRSLLLGLAFLAIAGFVSSWAKRRVPSGIAFAVPGAYIIAFGSDIPVRPWVLWLVFGAIVLGSVLAANFDWRHMDSGLVALLLAMTLGGVFLTVPDTEGILVLLGAAVPVLTLAWPRPLVRLGFGAFPLIGILMWVIAWGGRGRESSIVGAVACLGVLLVEPVEARLKRRSLPPPAVAITVIHVVLLLIVARIAGVQAAPGMAAAIATLALVTGTIGWWALPRGAESEYVAQRMDGWAKRP